MYFSMLHAVGDPRVSGMYTVMISGEGSPTSHRIRNLWSNGIESALFVNPLVFDFNQYRRFQLDWRFNLEGLQQHTPEDVNFLKGQATEGESGGYLNRGYLQIFENRLSQLLSEMPDVPPAKVQELIADYQQEITRVETELNAALSYPSLDIAERALNEGELRGLKAKRVELERIAKAEQDSEDS